MTSAAEKQEVTVCNASIMKDVWEIRSREYGQKLQNEEERIENSALETINQDWQKRMTSKEKYPKRLARKPKSVEEEDSYLSRDRGYLGSQSQRPKMAVGKGQLKHEKLQRLISLTSAQPNFMVWAKSWKFSKSQPQQEGAALPSNWGKSWQFMTLQPHIEGKPWPQQNGPTPHQDTYILYEKPVKMMDSQHFQSILPVTEWEKSFKYTKSDIKQKLEAKAVSKGNQDREEGAQYSKTRMLDMLVESQHYNEALSSSEWKESWMSTKPPTGVEAPVKKPDNGPLNDLKKDGKSGSQLPESWRFINKQHHLNGKPYQTSNNLEWAGSWRAATTVSTNNKKEKSHGPLVYGELGPQESHHHHVIMFVSREQKYRELWSWQLCDENNLMSGWDKSWETTKNLSEPGSEAIAKVEKPDEKPKESEKFVIKVPRKKVDQTGRVQSIMPQKTIVSKLSKFTKLMSPLLIPDLPCEWKEAWKSPKPQFSKVIMKVGNGIPDASMILKQHLKNWSESYKCARAYHVKPSAPEWKESWLSRYQPHAGREHSMQQPKHDIYLSKRTTADKMLHHVKHMEKGLLTTEWTESWKCLKHQRRMEHMRTRLHRSRLFREPVTEERPTTEWGNSWRFTSHNLNQESDLWQQGWSNMPRARPNRAIDQHHFMEEEVPQNGPTGRRSWNTSWRFSRCEHRMEVQQPAPHRMEAEQPGPSTRGSQRLSREPVIEGRPTSEWDSSWRSTSHTLGQESDLWQQGWSNMPSPRPDRAIDQHHFMVEEVPRNGPVGGRTWNTSWRSPRGEHHMEVEQPGAHCMEVEQPRRSTYVDRLPPRGGRTVGDWEESWMVSSGQFRHDRPSMTEWTESWRWSVFHTDRWGEEQPKQNWHDKSLVIIPSREKWQMKTAMTKIGRSFDSQLLKDLQYTQFNESWMAATLQRHHYKPLSVLDKSKSRCFHLKNSKASMKEWTDSWKFLNIHFSQRKEAWAAIRVANTMSHKSDVEPAYQVNDDDDDNNSSNAVPYNTVSTWGKSWKISNPMAHTDKGSWLDCHDNQSQYGILWSRVKSNHLYANLHKETAMLRLWGKSWRFLKMESKADSKSGKSKYKESKGGLELVAKRIKTKKHIYSQIEKDKPSERRWLDNHKLMKTQPRPKRDAWLNKPQVETKEKEGFTQQWEGSWRFSNLPQKKEAVKVCLKSWGDSWKYLLPPYPAQKGSTSM